MKIFYDTEFIEDGETIDLISIGMVREDGEELYKIYSPHMPPMSKSETTVGRAVTHPWLRENVIPGLPVKLSATHVTAWSWDQNHPDWDNVETNDARFRQQVLYFITEPIKEGQQPELWAWYAAYDHVALCQLWGPMIDLPPGIPIWTNDLKQEAHRLDNPPLPELPGKQEHHALWDARELQMRYEWIRAYENHCDGKTLDAIVEQYTR